MRRFLAGVVLTVALTGCSPRSEYGRDFFVRIPDVVPDAILEIRYFSTYNFIGERIDGYEAPTALLTRQAADSLRVVSDELRQLG